MKRPPNPGTVRASVPRSGGGAWGGGSPVPEGPRSPRMAAGAAPRPWRNAPKARSGGPGLVPAGRKTGGPAVAEKGPPKPGPGPRGGAGVGGGDLGGAEYRRR